MEMNSWVEHPQITHLEKEKKKTERGNDTERNRMSPRWGPGLDNESGG